LIEFDKICGWNLPAVQSGDSAGATSKQVLEPPANPRNSRAAHIRTTNIFGKTGFLSCYVQSAGSRWTYEGKLQHSRASPQAPIPTPSRTDPPSAVFASATTRSAEPSRPSRTEQLGARKAPRQDTAPIPGSFSHLYREALRMCGASARCYSPRARADLCFCNLYPRHWGKMGWHSDADESKVSLSRGDPVVSLSVGDACEFGLFIPRELDDVGYSLYRGLGAGSEAGSGLKSGEEAELGSNGAGAETGRSASC